MFHTGTNFSITFFFFFLNLPLGESADREPQLQTAWGTGYNMNEWGFIPWSCVFLQSCPFSVTHLPPHPNSPYICLT